MNSVNPNKLAFLGRPLTNADVERLTHKLHKAGLIHCCLTCVHFNERGSTYAPPGPTPAETCTLYNVRPPARVIAYGCESWEDGIPF
jgi:hypothetical protein